MKMKNELNQITNIEIEKIDHSDAPDYSDAYISYAEFNGKPLTEKELEEVNDYPDFVYASVVAKIS